MNLDWIDEIGSAIIVITALSKIAAVNSQACRILKYGREELYGLDFHSIVEDPAHEIRDLIKSLTQEKNVSFLDNARLIGKTGEKNQIQGTAIRVEAPDVDSHSVLLFCHSTFDEIGLPQSEGELSVRDFQVKTLGRMTEGLLNDFRNIFGLIGGYAEMLQEDEHDITELRNDISEILSACGRGKMLLDNIHAISKSSQSANIYFEVERSIVAILNTLKATLPQNISLKYSSTIENSSIAADPMKLEQVLLGICLALGDLGNVTNSRESITIALGNKKISALFPGNVPEENLCVQILIRSDKISVSNRFIDCFNSYDEAYFSSRNELESILCTGRRILSDCNGKIFLEHYGKNRTAISILFPVVDKRTMGRPAYMGPPLGNGQFILIVDDEIQVADLTARRLEKHNYHVVKKTNSMEALEYFASNSEQFSLMIIDQVMPDLEGLDLAREALKIKPNLPIIMMTGYSSGITEKKCKEYGIGYLAMKPIDEKELATIVAHALRHIQPEKRL